MGRRVELPKMPGGTPAKQLEALYSYLYQMAETLNHNLAEIGSNDLTDEEREIINGVTGGGANATGSIDENRSEAETLKSLIIKTAGFVQNELNQYRMNLLGDYVAEGKFGKYVRNTGLSVDVTPEHIQQNFTFAEIIQGLKTYEINAKNYIKTGWLRTENNIPIYGVAIGKDIVTFAQDGTETYNDGNKVAELTADELSFWQSGNKIASYTGTKISFFYGGSEVFYIQNGKMYAAGDMEITAGKTFKIASGGIFDVDTENMSIDSRNGSMQMSSAASGNNKKIIYEFNRSTVYNPETMEYQFLLDEVSHNNQPCLSMKYRKTISDTQYYYQDIDVQIEDFTHSDFGWTTSQETVFFTPSSVKFKKNDHGGYSNDGVLYNSLGKPNMHFYYAYFGWVYTAELVAGSSVKTGTVEARYYITTSSKEIKHDIREMDSRGEQLDRLRPVTFVYDDDPEEKTRAGLIYEDTVEVMPEICTGDEDNKAINYVELVPMLLKEIQELRARVKALEEGGH